MGHRGEKRSDRPYRHSDKRKAERQWRRAGTGQRGARDLDVHVGHD